MVFGNGVKNIQAAAYHGARTVGKIPLSAKGITDEITDNHPIDICSVGVKL